jgi:Icc protein
VEGVGLITRLTLDSSVVAGAPRELHCAFLADPHIAANPEQLHHGRSMSFNLARTAVEVAAISPDVALLVGDVAFQRGSAGDYEQFRRLIKPLEASTPVCLTLGNHDDRSNFLGAFSPASIVDGDVPGKSIVIIESTPFRIILLDSLFRTDLVPGLLGKAQRDWLGNFLTNAAPMITLVCVHHPLADGDTNLLDSDRLLEVLSTHSSVKAVLHGHDHAYRHRSENGIPVVGLPAIGLPLQEGEALGWIEAHLDENGGRLRFHATEETVGAELPVERYLAWRSE